MDQRRIDQRELVDSVTATAEKATSRPGRPRKGMERPWPERFWEKVVQTDGCWLWTSPPTRFGYGRFQINRKVAYGAHRISYELLVGPVPDGLFLDHLCCNKLCVNPKHLEPVTRSENMRRAYLNGLLNLHNSRKTHCPRGHEYSPENTYLQSRLRASGGIGYSRVCRSCMRLRVR